MTYELFTYVTPPGRRAALVKRFREGTLALFARHGIEVVGMWVDDVDVDRLHYVTRFADAAARDAAWAAFAADPEWQELRRSSEAGGPLVTYRTRSILTSVLDGD